jgi:hypothetical protein
MQPRMTTGEERAGQSAQVAPPVTLGCWIFLALSQAARRVERRVDAVVRDGGSRQHRLDGAGTAPARYGGGWGYQRSRRAGERADLRGTGSDPSRGWWPLTRGHSAAPRRSFCAAEALAVDLGDTTTVSDQISLPGRFDSSCAGCDARVRD